MLRHFLTSALGVSVTLVVGIPAGAHQAASGPRAIQKPATAPLKVPLIADDSEIPPIEREAVAPGPWTVDIVPRCEDCVWPAWPPPSTVDPPRFRLHLVVLADGRVGSVRIVQVLRGDPAARPVGIEGRVAQAQKDSPTARAGLAVLAAARQWRFKTPVVAPLLLTLDMGVDSEQPAWEPAEGITHRVGNEIPPPKKIVDVPPVYPPEAIASRRMGTVVVEASISSEGDIREARVVRSVDPMLDDAAVAAVLQWKYEPTRVNGTAVPVLMTVTVTFSLSEGPKPR